MKTMFFSSGFRRPGGAQALRLPRTAGAQFRGLPQVPYRTPATLFVGLALPRPSDQRSFQHNHYKIFLPAGLFIYIKAQSEASEKEEAKKLITSEKPTAEKAAYLVCPCQDLEKMKQ